MYRCVAAAQDVDCSSFPFLLVLPPLSTLTRKCIAQSRFTCICRGGYFSSIMANPELYLFKRESVKEWLVQQRGRGVDLFLVTNSHVNYR